MPSLSRRTIVRLVVLMIALDAVVVGIGIFWELRQAADYSAHAALTAEICQKLASIPRGQSYPTSLTQLQLTYPDGGSTSLLSRFTYSSTGTGCTVSTTLNKKHVGWSYP